MHLWFSHYGTFLQELSYLSVKKIFPWVIWYFSLGIEIEKMEAKVLFEVKAIGRDLGMVWGCHFLNWKTREKANYKRIIFWTLRKNNEWRRVFFQIFCFFLWLSWSLLKNLSKCEEMCPSVWKKYFSTHLDNFFSHLDKFFNTWTNFAILSKGV